MGQYSQAFINRGKCVYPSNMDMHNLAEENGYFLGRYLDDSSQGGLSIDTVLKSNSLEELKKGAQEIKERKDLYREWSEEVKGW